MPRVVLVCVLAAGAFVAVGGAQATWSIPGSGGGAAAALSMPAGPTPSASVAYPQVALAWSAVTIGGAAVDSYTLRRYSEAGAQQSITAACNGAVGATTGCTEADVPV